MDENFLQITKELDHKYHVLISMDPCTLDTIPKDCPIGGVYLFSNNGENLYVGKTKRKISERLKGHVNTAKDCPFAWHLAREATGYKPSYRPGGSRKDLLSRPEFKKVYDLAKQRIKQMQVRFVGEQDPLKQALLEIYVSIATKAKYNDFNTS